MIIKKQIRTGVHNATKQKRKNIGYIKTKKTTTNVILMVRVVRV